MSAVYQEIRALIYLALSVMSGLSLTSYQQPDPGFMHHTAANAPVLNKLGLFGAYFSDFLISSIGLCSYFVPAIFLLLAVDRFSNKKAATCPSATGITLLISSICGLLSIYIENPVTEYFTAGGILGSTLSFYLSSAFQVTGATLILSFGVICALMLSTQSTIKEMFTFRVSFLRGLFQRKEHSDRSQPTHFQQQKFSEMKSEPVEKPQAKPKPVVDHIKTRVVKSTRVTDKNHAKEISPNLLNVAKNSTPTNYKDKCDKMAEKLGSTLNEFNIEAQIVEYHPGPVVTRYEIDLAAGTKVSKITTLAKDLARNLSVTAVRVVEVIPGKHTVGIEIPNDDRLIVSYREILESKAYTNSRSLLPLALGKDISGYPVVVDLVKMPHLLVAGTTGSGKSVGLNSMLLSMLFKAPPEELRLIMIDPKMLELSVYEDIPHLLTPVVTDMNKAGTALEWCVEEMERRYLLMAALGVRNIGGYNEKVKEMIKSGKDLFEVANEQYADKIQDTELQTLPHIVIVADEFADLIMVVGKKIEQLIARLAQKARASGIHIILATQRPSVDVITGLIKANIPTRIAFQVSSKIDSRTILDQQGAEQLLGHGDMLYLPPGTGIPIRVHGAFVSDDEVHRVCTELKSRGKPEYIDMHVEAPSDDGGDSGSSSAESDPLYDEAVEFVVSTQKVSVSSVQRKLRIGYNRSANLVEAMEQSGVVSPAGSNGQRRVLVPKND